MNICNRSHIDIDLLSWLQVVDFHVRSFSYESLESLRQIGLCWPPKTTGLDPARTEIVNKLYIDVTEAARTKTFDRTLSQRVWEMLSYVDVHFQRIRAGNLP